MAKPKCSDFAMTLTKMALNLGSREGVKNLADVHAEIQKRFPTISREMLADAISEATTGLDRRVDDVVAKLNSIKREARTDKQLRDKITDLQQHLESGTVPTKRANEGVVTDPIRALRDIRDGLRAQIKNSEPAIKQRLEASIVELERRIDEGDILPKSRKVEMPKSKELEALVFERDRLRQEIRQQVKALEPQTIWERVADPFNFARALMTSIDLSAVLRQGGFIVMGHPVRGVKTIPDMLKAFASERTALKINVEIQERPNAPLYARTKLYFGALEGGMGKAEEAFMSRLARKIPLVRASERAYVTFLNKLRADSFDAMADSLGATREVTQVEAEAISGFINTATGRGPLVGFERSAIALSTVFFAPRYVSSRFALLAGQPLYKGNARTRTMIAKEYARYLMGMGTVYFLAQAAGAEVGSDPTSSDFGKIKVGNTRLDPLSGLSQVAVLTSRIASGKSTSPVTGISKDVRGPDMPFGAANTFELMTNFARSKLSPLAGTAVNVAVGKDLSGQEVTAKSTALQLVTPLSVSDIYDAIKEQGVPAGAALSLVGLLGAGMQTFKASEKQKANLLYAATSPRSERKKGESVEEFDKRKSKHTEEVSAAMTALEKMGITDPDEAVAALTAEVKRRGGSVRMRDANFNWTSFAARVSALRKALEKSKMEAEK